MTIPTETTHKCSFPVRPPHSLMNPGPCGGCGKTYPRSQAEQMLAEAVAAMNATEPDHPVGIEHATVDDLRRELVQDSASWREVANRNRSCAHQKAAVVKDAAYTGNLMAANYSYTIAALLAVARSEYGESAARRLAFTAATILIDGDGNDLNADVKPATSTSNQQGEPS